MKFCIPCHCTLGHERLVRPLRTLTLLAVMWTLTSAASHAQTKSQLPPNLNETAAKTTAPAPNINSELNAQWMLEILLGEIYHLQGDTAKSYSLLLDVAKKSQDDKLFERVIELALQARAGEAALEAAKSWGASNPKSKTAFLYVFQILVALGQLNDSELALHKLIELTPKTDLADLFRSIPQQYVRVENKEKAADLVEHALENFKTSKTQGAAAWNAIGQMRLMAKNAPAAMQAVHKAHALNAQAMDAYWLALALMQENHSEAESFLRDNMKQRGVFDKDFLLNHARVLLSLSRTEEGLIELKGLVKDQPTFAKAWFFLASTFGEMGQDLQARAAWLRYLALDTPNGALVLKDRDQAYLALAQLDAKRMLWSQALNWLEQVKDEKNTSMAMNQRAQILNAQGKTQEALATLEELPEDSAPAQRFKLMSQVQLLRDQGQALKALGLLQAASQAEPDDDDLTYQLAMTYEKLGLRSDMERVLQEIIARSPSYYSAYNALGYAWADHNEHLNEAKGLIVKALDFAPTDAFIMDSLGWVEFKLKHWDESVAILKKAYSLKADSEIAAHLGEVLQAMGKTQAAREIWQEGLENSPQNPTLLETMKRLSASTPY